MIHKERDTSRNKTGKERIIIPVFELYEKEIGDCNRRERITTHIYEIRTSPKNAEMLKNLLIKISNEGNTNLKFIPHGIHAVSKVGTIRNIILQHNVFLKNKAIVSIVNIQDKNINKVKTHIDNSLYFSEWEPTRQATKWNYLLITNKSVVNNAQNEVDNLLVKYYATLLNNNASETPGRMKKPLLHSQFLNYTSALSKKINTTPHNVTITTPLNYKRPTSILFNAKHNPNIYPYSAYTKAPKKRIHNDEITTDSQTSTNDQIPSNKRKHNSDWTSFDTYTTCSNSDNITSTTWNEELTQLKQESNNNIKKIHRRKQYKTH